ncbi:MAG: DUF2083 domain-containing protein, partial [Myxococcales bacterium]|nr:DUF2083 domain-containing protein [Myxococcales bacterium]
PAELLFRAADALKVDVRQFTVDTTTAVLGELMEVLDDPELHDVDIKATDVRELVQTNPAVGRAFVEVYKKWKASQEDVRTLGAVAPDAVGTLDPGRLPSEEVNDLIARQANHFDEVESVAELYWRRYDLSFDRVYDGLASILREVFRVEVRVASPRAVRGVVRHYDPDRRLLTISEALPPRSRRFHVAHQIGLLSLGATFDRVLADPGLTTAASRRLGRMVLANYFAGALLMPYERFWEAAESERYDIDLLGHRFRTSFEQVVHRLTTLRRSGMEGVPFHLVKTDLAGNVSKRFNGSGITFARVGGRCPLWNVHHAFLQPGRYRVQVQEMPDGTRYFEVARTVSRQHGGFHEPETLHAIGLGC